MTKPVRFQFDTEFGAVKPTGEPQVPLSQHTAAVEEAEARGYARGSEDAAAAEAAAAERAMARGLDRVGDELTRIAESMPQLERRLEVEAVEIAVAVARKLTGALLKREPMAEIERLVADCLTELRATPHLAVSVNDALLEPTKARLDRLAAEAGFGGRIVVLADPDIVVGDVRIEWADGGVVRDSHQQNQQIDELIQRFIAGRASHEPRGHRS